jgi:hypothetical protein
MKESFGDSSRWLPLTLVAALLVLVGFGGVTFLNAHARSVDAQKQAEQIQAARVAKEWKASMATAVAKKKAQDRQDAKLKAAEKKAAVRYKAEERAQEKAAARRRAARKAAAKQKAVQAAAHQAAQVAAVQAAKQAKVAKQQAVAQQAADAEAAAQQAAAKKAKGVQAALIKAATEAAAGAAEQEATVTLPLTRTITGQVTEPDVVGALMPRVGASPGESTDDLSMYQLNRLQAYLAKVNGGKTYPCPRGSGGQYSDISRGARVYVEDRSRTAVATGSLTGGVLSKQGCTFDFRVRVPDLPFYRINVTQRGQMVYSHRDMARRGWRVWLRAL